VAYASLPGKWVQKDLFLLSLIRVADISYCWRK
jgi:hypothetical protein